jgi:trigger factor
MEVFSYAMAQPYKIMMTVPKEEVVEKLSAFWSSKGEDMMKSEPGSWTKLDAFKDHMEKKMGAKLYWDIVWEWVQVGAAKSGLRIENVNNVNINKLDTSSGAVLAVTVNVLPGVKLGDYKNIRIQEPPMYATNKEVEGQMLMLTSRSPLAKKLELSKQLEEGDLVQLSYVCKLVETGEEVDAREDIIVSMRSGPGSALTASVLGEFAPSEITKTVTLPDNFPKAEMAGKEVECNFKISHVIKNELPTLEEEAARLEKTLDEWTASVKEDIEKNKRETFDLRRRDFLRTEIEKYLLTSCEVEPLPDSMIEKETDSLLKSLARSRGKELEEYLSEINATQDDAFRQMAPMAMRRIMIKLVIDAIFEAEEMKISDEDREQYLVKYSEATESNIDEVRKEFENADISFLIKTFMVDEFLCAGAILLPTLPVPPASVVLEENPVAEEPVMVAE